QFALCLCRHTPHLLRELTLRCCPGAITLGPYSRLIRCPNLHALPHDPHPRPLPTRGGEQSEIAAPAAGHLLTPSPARDSRAAGGTSADSPTRSSASRR